MPEDDRRRLRAAAVRFRNVLPCTSATVVVFTAAAVALTLLPCVRSSGRAASWTDANATRDDDGPITRLLRDRLAHAASTSRTGRRAPVRLHDAATGRDVGDFPSRTDRRRDGPVDAGAYRTTRGIYFGGIPIGDDQQTSMTRRQIYIPAEKNIVPNVQQIPIMNKISWRKIGIMTLIKLGLVKLKTIGFIKFLYFLIFKIKFLLTTFFFKFLSLLKFYKIFKFLILPLSLFPLLSTIILSLIPSLLSLVNTTGYTAFDRLSVPTELIYSVAPTQSTASQVILVPEEVTVSRPQIVTEFVDPITELINTINSIRYDTSELIDPTLKLLQKELSSEKCIERIACKMATTGKASIIPMWINWVLHRVSKLVPRNQLLYYLKTYVDVTNEINVNQPNPENWETWCSERYNCNSNYETNDFL